jgi:hypothetical protein
MLSGEAIREGNAQRARSTARSMPRPACPISSPSPSAVWHEESETTAAMAIRAAAISRRGECFMSVAEMSDVAMLPPVPTAPAVPDTSASENSPKSCRMSGALAAAPCDLQPLQDL